MTLWGDDAYGGPQMEAPADMGLGMGMMGMDMSMAMGLGMDASALGGFGTGGLDAHMLQSQMLMLSQTLGFEQMRVEMLKMQEENRRLRNALGETNGKYPPSFKDGKHNQNNRGRDGHNGNGHGGFNGCQGKQQQQQQLSQGRRQERRIPLPGGGGAAGIGPAAGTGRANGSSGGTSAGFAGARLSGPGAKPSTASRPWNSMFSDSDDDFIHPVGYAPPPTAKGAGGNARATPATTAQQAADAASSDGPSRAATPPAPPAAKSTKRSLLAYDEDDVIIPAHLRPSAMTKQARTARRAAVLAAIAVAAAAETLKRQRREEEEEKEEEVHEQQRGWGGAPPPPPQRRSSMMLFLNGVPPAASVDAGAAPLQLQVAQEALAVAPGASPQRRVHPESPGRVDMDGAIDAGLRTLLDDWDDGTESLDSGLPHCLSSALDGNFLDLLRSDSCHSTEAMERAVLATTSPSPRARTRPMFDDESDDFVIQPVR